MTDMPTRYKVILNKKSCHGGTFDWTDYLPKGNRPGKWTPPIDDVSVCSFGYHLTTDPMQWPKVGMKVYVAQGKPTQQILDDKSSHSSARLLRDVTDEVVPQYWRDVEAFVASPADIPWMIPQGDPDPSWKVFETLTAAGSTTRYSAWSAAGFAAWSAPGFVPRSVARSAAGSAAWSAAWFAAESAAWFAARSAAGSATRSAAWFAAGSAAESAAESAELVACILCCPPGSIEQRHIDYAHAAMDVWLRGYGLAGDVNGVLYVYRSIK